MLYQTINPYTEELVRTFPLNTDAEIESIIATAEKTYATDWSRRSIAERKAVIGKAASILRERIDEFAKLATLEMEGVPTENDRRSISTIRPSSWYYL